MLLSKKEIDISSYIILQVPQKHLVPQNQQFYFCIAIFPNVMIFKKTLVFIIWLIIGLRDKLKKNHSLRCNVLKRY